MFILTLACVIFFLGKNLLPSNTMFQFHDETQAARVQEFTFNLKNGTLPPRVAPHFSFQMGYPVFNFYAPFSYWITSSLHIIGLDVADSLKLSFLIALIIAFTGMYAFLRLYFKFSASVLGAVLYVASPWLASEIFVRGNLAEVWFWALFPLALYAIYEQDEYDSPIIFGATVFILSCVLTVHNIFSLLFVPIAIIYIWLSGNKVRNYLGLLLSILLSSYFLLPALAENSLTYAREVATMTKYTDHFLCIKQLWSAPFWGYGGSAPGCVNDGMAFMVGKTQIVLGGIGIILFALSYFILKYKNHHLFKKIIKIILSQDQEEKTKPLRSQYAIHIKMAVMILTVLSIFLTLSQSTFIWEIFSPILSLFQFPWRFLFFIVFGLAFFTSYFLNKFKFKAILFIIPLIGLFSLISTSKYFAKPTISKKAYNIKYLSDSYIQQSVAYKIPEYLPRTAKYLVWREFENEDIATGSVIKSMDGKQVVTVQNDEYNKFAKTSSEKFLLDIHYFPFWEIRINNEVYKPTSFDNLGRPQISTLPGSKTVEITYKQTLIEMTGNIITVLTFLLLIIYILSPIIIGKKKFKKLRLLLHI